MLAHIGAALAVATFTVYSGPKAADTRIEAVTDRGPILELIVRCPQGTAIITYSKVERLYCDPRLVCDTTKEPVVTRSCR